MNFACDYEVPMQMLTTEKYIAAWTLAKFTQLKRNKRFVNFIMLIGLGVTR